VTANRPGNFLAAIGMVALGSVLYILITTGPFLLLTYAVSAAIR
jgi:hypothetical protein